jgi:hypothetical protein
LVNASRHYSLELRILQSSTNFMHNLLIKTQYDLCKSCRGSADLQLSYSNLGVLQFNFLDIHPVKVGQSEMFATRQNRARPSANAERRPRRAPTRPGRRGRAATWRARCSVPHNQRALHLDHHLFCPLSLRHAPIGRAAPTSATRRPPLAGHHVHVAALPHPCRDHAIGTCESPLLADKYATVQPPRARAQSAAAGRL